MADYTKQDIEAMQRDAIQRVHRMQEIAAQKIKQSEDEVILVKNHESEIEEENILQESAIENEEKSVNNDINIEDILKELNTSKDTVKGKTSHKKTKPTNPASNPMDFISKLTKNILPGMDGDRILLLFLIFMLQKEEVDTSLILALLYMAI